MTIKNLLAAASRDAKPASRTSHFQMTIRRVIPTFQQTTVTLAFPDYFSPTTIQAALEDYARAHEKALNWKTLRYAQDDDPLFECGAATLIEDLPDDSFTTNS